MFTGIVQTMGTVASLEARGGEHDGDVRLTLGCPGLDAAPALGDSVAVSGACLTVVARDGDVLVFDVSRETLAMTTLGELAPGSSVNLEAALTLATPLGGHLVSGHVDGVGRLLERHVDARSVRMLFEAPAELARYLAPKGAICVDGVSLTVNEVEGGRFGVNIVPHTAEGTTLGELAPGARANLEADMVARYLDRLLEERGR